MPNNQSPALVLANITKTGIILLLFLLTGGFMFSGTEQRLKLIFAGDIMMHGPQIEAATIVKNESYDYDPCFEYIKPLIQQADLAIGNLEFTLPGKPPYTGWPNFKAPDQLAKTLRDTGFDVLTTSNNHSNDAGKNGVINTIETLRENGFYQTGTYKNQLEKSLFHPLVIYKNGMRLAFLNYTYGTDKKKHRPPTIVNLIDPVRIEEDIVLAKRMEVDFIIVMMHWGKEYKLEPSREQRMLTNKMFSWGADMVIGGHPHVVQPIEEITPESKVKNRSSKLVAYSLGNFISNQQKPNTDGGILLEVDLVKKAGRVSIEDYHYFPVWRSIRNSPMGKKLFQVIPIGWYEYMPDIFPVFSDKSQQKMEKFATFIRDHLDNSDCPEFKFHRKKPTGLGRLFH